MSESALPFDAQTLRNMRHGSEAALAEVFSSYRERLRRIVRFRMDHRLAGRLSESDVLQETFLAAAKRLDQFAAHESMPAFLWLRLLANQQLVDLHRRHFRADKRDVRREVSIDSHAPSPHTSLAIAAQLAGPATAVSELMARAERIDRLEKTLNDMDPVDREVIALRHFEELSNVETAEVLGIQRSAASKRYVRAMARLAELLSQFAAQEEAR